MKLYISITMIFLYLKQVSNKILLKSDPRHQSQGKLMMIGMNDLVLIINKSTYHRIHRIGL